MSNLEECNGGENFYLHQLFIRGRDLDIFKRTDFFKSFIDQLADRHEMLNMRCVISPADREVLVVDPYTKKNKSMLMFGSNNYLGLANHPYVIAAAHRALEEYGAGIGGPPLLNGYTKLQRQLEEKLAELKGAEDALIFSSGYGANVGLITGLINRNDIVLYDAYSHASFCDGIKMSGVSSARFSHNNLDRLRNLLRIHQKKSSGNVFVGVEGVYSMDGDLAPLDQLVPICKSSGAILIVDDAHGTGVMGENGKGTAEHFHVEGQIDINMGTFSKTLAVSGGFVAASKPIINYLRFFARSHMFSASMPPVVIAIALAGLEVIEREQHLIKQLRENVSCTVNGLHKLGFNVNSCSGIIPLRVPEWMNIRQAAYKFHMRNIFVNSVEYPAVPLSQQRFRISLMATHTSEDIKKLLTAIEEVWNECKNEQMHTSINSDYQYVA